MTQVVQNFLTMALWGSIASLAVLAVRPLIKKSSNRILCLLWVVVMFRFLCPFTVEGPIPAFWSAGVQKEAVPVAKNETVDVLQGSEDVADSEQIYQESEIALANTQTDLPENAMTIQATGVENTVKNESEASQISNGENYLSVSVPSSGAENATVADVPVLTENNLADDAAAHTQNHVKAGMTAQSLLCILGVIWLIGTILLLAFGVKRYISICRALKEAVRIKEWKKYPVMVSDVSGVPMSFGIFHPGIYVPVSFDESVKIYDQDGQEKKPVFTDKQKEMILWHETMHLHHLDPLWKVVSFVMVAIHWWNPLAWISVKCMNQDLEMACDEAVLAQIGHKERGEYANTLLGFAAKQSGFSLVAAFGESHAESRIKNALKYRKSPLWVSALTLILVLGFAGCLATNPAEKKEGEQAAVEASVDQNEAAAQSDEAEGEQLDAGQDSTDTQSDGAENGQNSAGQDSTDTKSAKGDGKKVEVYETCGYRSFSELEEDVKIAIDMEDREDLVDSVSWSDLEESYYIDDSGVLCVLVPTRRDYLASIAVRNDVTYADGEVVHINTYESDNRLVVEGRDYTNDNVLWKYVSKEDEPEDTSDFFRGLITAHRGRVYIADWNVLYVLDAKTGTVITGGESGIGWAQRRVFDENGDLYVTSYITPEIIRYDENGKEICSTEVLYDYFLSDNMPIKLRIDGDKLIVDFDEGGSITLDKETLEVISRDKEPDR